MLPGVKMKVLTQNMALVEEPIQQTYDSIPLDQSIVVPMHVRRDGDTWDDGVRQVMRRRPKLIVIGETQSHLTSLVERRPGRQAGIGALEYIAIAAFFVVVLGGVLARSGMLSFTTNNVAENGAISALWQSVKSNVKSAAGYGPTGTNLIPVLKDTTGIPANLPFDGTNLQNTYGQNYTIVSTGSGFTLTDPGISKADCIKILVQQSSNGNWNTGILVNSGSATTGAIPTATAQTACTNATDNSITFQTSY
jgi:hypothetical protein